MIGHVVGSQGGGQMLQAGRLEPASHDGITGISSRSMEGTATASATRVIIQSSCCGGIALLHLATHVALGTALGRQLEDLGDQIF